MADVVANCTVSLVWDCPYRGRCTENGLKCGTCANTPKKSYYIPETPYTPYPYYPIWLYPTYYQWRISPTCSAESHYQAN